MTVMQQFKPLITLYKFNRYKKMYLGSLWLSIALNQKIKQKWSQCSIRFNNSIMVNNNRTNKIEFNNNNQLEKEGFLN
jgi:hypothetical protein